MTGCYFSRQMKWHTESGVLKNIYCLYKNLILQVDPFNNAHMEELVLY